VDDLAARFNARRSQPPPPSDARTDGCLTTAAAAVDVGESLRRSQTLQQTRHVFAAAALVTEATVNAIQSTFFIARQKTIGRLMVKA